MVLAGSNAGQAVPILSVISANQVNRHLVPEKTGHLSDVLSSPIAYNWHIPLCRIPDIGDSFARQVSGLVTGYGWTGSSAPAMLVYVPGCVSDFWATQSQVLGTPFPNGHRPWGCSAKLARVQNVPEDGDSEPGMESTQKVETHPCSRPFGSHLTPDQTCAMICFVVCISQIEYSEQFRRTEGLPVPSLTVHRRFKDPNPQLRIHS